MKTVIVGDLHGKYDTAEKVLAMKNCQKVFVGDYLDSFLRNIDDQVRTFRLVTDAALAGECIALAGNHELSYFVPGCRCSGWNFNTDSHLVGIQDTFWKALRPYVWVEDFLVTHAGLNWHYLLQDKTMVEKGITGNVDVFLREVAIAWKDKNINQFTKAGRARGGAAFWGGIFWNDFFKEFTPVPNLKQVFGHTGWRPRGQDAGIHRVQDNYLIDCLEYGPQQVLTIENGKVEILEL